MADNATISGYLTASDEIAGVHYQRIKLVHGADGSTDGDVARTNALPVELRHRHPAYALFVPVGAAGANKVHFDLFNAGGSGVSLRVKSVEAIKEGAVAITGVLAVSLFLTRTSAVGTGGTAATSEGTALTAPTISKIDPANAALPSQVTARAAPTGGATAGAVIAQRQVFTEETSAASYEAVEFMHPADSAQPLVIPEGTGIRIVQGAVASLGSVGFRVRFEAA